MFFVYSRNICTHHRLALLTSQIKRLLYSFAKSWVCLCLPVSCLALLNATACFTEEFLVQRKKMGPICEDFPTLHTFLGMILHDACDMLILVHKMAPFFQLDCLWDDGCMLYRSKCQP